MVPYRSFPPTNEILSCDSRQNSNRGIAMPDLQNLLSPNLCQNTTVLHGKILKLKHVFVCKLCTEKSAESHWTETVHIFKDCYPNLIDIENPLDKNETDVRVETESISPTDLGNSEESRQNFEDILQDARSRHCKILHLARCKIKTLCKNRFKNVWNLIMKKTFVNSLLQSVANMD